MGKSTVLRPDILYMVQPYLQRHHMLFSEVAVGQSSNFRTLRPLCPTRWTMRIDAIQNVVSQYECVLDVLEALTWNPPEVRQQNQKRALLASRVALVGFGILENLCKALQGKSQTISGMLAAVDHNLSRQKEAFTVRSCSIKNSMVLTHLSCHVL
jgi:hypothetical protein